MQNIELLEPWDLEFEFSLREYVVFDVAEL
jgi:hypothetical protein